MFNKQTQLNLAVLLTTAVSACCPVVTAESLEPSAPSGPTMKTLDEVEPRIPMSSLPFTISKGGSYYVTGNLTSDANGVCPHHLQRNLD